MSIFKLYLLTRLDEIKELLQQLIILSFNSFLILQFITIMNNIYDDKSKMSYMVHISILIISIILGIIEVLIPTKKDIGIILGSHFLTNEEQAQKLPKNILKTVNDLLEISQIKIEELKDKK